MPLSRPMGLLVALCALCCEVSTPVAGPSPSAAQVPAKAQPATPPVVTKAPAPPRAEPAPPVAPPEPPPWSTAAGLAYREVVLGTDDPSQPLPMVVAIHGLGDDPDNFRHVLDHFVEPVRVILPRGIDAYEGGGWSWFPVRARDPDVTALAEGIGKAADHIATGLRELRTTRPTKGLPIVTGFSQGGMLTFALAVGHPDVVGHAVAVGGWLPPPLIPGDKGKGTTYPQIHALHGTTDVAVPLPPTQAAIEALQGAGFGVTLHTYEGVGHMIPPPMRRDLHDLLIDAVRKARRTKPKTKPKPKPKTKP